MSDAWTAICAVSRSRISPTSTTLGSCRRIDRRAAAKVSPAFSWTCTCTIPAIRYSTGSSTVTMFTPSPLIRLIMEYRVVDLPDPVGPVTRMIPSWFSSSRWIAWLSPGFRPSESSDLTVARESRMRMTTFSPRAAGSVETRRSIGWLFTDTRARPSCGRIRSAMSSDDMILIREIRGTPAARGIFITWRSTPSMRYRTATPPSSGSMWMSLDRERIPSEMIKSTSLTTGRWLASASVAVRLMSSGGASVPSVTRPGSAMPSRRRSSAFSGRYSSSSLAAIWDGAASSRRISRVIANAIAFSASRSKGLDVAISRNESVIRMGATRNRRASCSGTRSRMVRSTCGRLAIFRRYRADSFSRICASVATFFETSVSHSDWPGSAWLRSSANRSGVSSPSRDWSSHSSGKVVSAIGAFPKPSLASAPV